MEVHVDTQQQEQDEMFGDIVDNTNPVFAALQQDDLIMANMYIHHN